MKMKKICLFATLVILVALSLIVGLASFAYADEVSPMVYQPGTSYTHSHSITVNDQEFNNAPEAHAFYWFNQKSQSLPVQVYYAVYPHLEAGVQITQECNISLSVKHKFLGFLWETTAERSAEITYDALYGNENVTGHVDGPNYDAISSVTVYSFADNAYGLCTWTITAN